MEEKVSKTAREVIAAEFAQALDDAGALAEESGKLADACLSALDAAGFDIMPKNSPSPPSSRSPPSAGEGIHIEEPWVIRKCGAFYRANRAGYTDSIYEAGIYSREDAEAEARIEPSITAHPYSEFAQAREEEIARVIYEAEYDRESYPWGNASDAEKLTYRAQARAVLSLLRGGSND